MSQPLSGPPSDASPGTLLGRLVEAIDVVTPLVAPPAARTWLTGLCATVRVALGAQAVSVARLDGEHLVYEAADGAGSDTVVGLRLTISRGVAGYVARTGQSLAVDQVRDDPRFARDVAERTGYVPTSLLVVPAIDDRGEVCGVLSVLDRSPDRPAALAVASTAAAQAALLLPSVHAVIGLGAMFVSALSAAVEQQREGAEPETHQQLALLLRAEADRLSRRGHNDDDNDDGSDDDGEAAGTASLARLAALLAELRAAGPGTIATAERIIAEVAALGRRRR